MPTMKVNWYYADTYWEDDPSNTRWTIIGVLLGDWKDGMCDTYLDSRTVYWFDTDAEVLALKKGSVFGDGLVIDEISYEPDYREEEFELSEYDLLENTNA